MNASRSLLLFLIPFFFLSATIAELKVWSPRPNAAATNWQPSVTSSSALCASQSLVYQPNAFFETLPMQQLQTLNTTTAPLRPPRNFRRLVLPANGAIMLPDAATLFAASDSSSGRRCNVDRDYLQQAVYSPPYWYDPTAWLVAGQTANQARPLVNRVPCECDSVVLTSAKNGSGSGGGGGGSSPTLAIRLNDDDQLLIRDIRLTSSAGDTGVPDTLDNLMGSPLAGRLFTSTGQTAARKARCSAALATADPVEDSSPCGCHSAERYADVLRSVCSAVVCPADVGCMEPIRIPGMCCPMCGAVLRTDSMPTCPRQLLVGGGDGGGGGGDIGRRVQRMLVEMDGGKWLGLVDVDITVEPSLNVYSGVFDSYDFEYTQYTGQLTIVDRGAGDAAGSAYRGDSAEVARKLLAEPVIGGEPMRLCVDDSWID